MAEANNQVAQRSSYGNTASQIARITDAETARKMVLKYATDLVGQERAREFFMHMAFLERTNNAIARCSPDSKFKAMMEAVNLNLMPNTADQYCALVPYKGELQLQPMYKGGIELAYRSDQVRTIKADNVFPEDDFDYDDAMNTISHKKNLTVDRTDIKRITAVYAVARLKNGEIMFEVVSPSEIEKIRKESVKAGSVDSPWSKWPERMYRKTALKRLIGILPKSAADNRLSKFVQIDDAREAGKHTAIDLDTGEVIEGEVADQGDAKKAEARARIEAAAEKRKNMTGHTATAVPPAPATPAEPEQPADTPEEDELAKVNDGTLLDDVDVETPAKK